MGMLDHITYEAPCPFCDTTLDALAVEGRWLRDAEAHPLRAMGAEAQ
jgi:hypothetical protein